MQVDIPYMDPMGIYLLLLAKNGENHVPFSGISILIFAACWSFLKKKQKYVNLQEFIHQQTTSWLGEP